MRRTCFTTIYLLLAFVLSAVPLTSQMSFTNTQFKGSVGSRSLGVEQSSGVISLTRTGVSFESKDFVFDIPIDDILGVEYRGARVDFIALLLDKHSRFISGYRSLITNRFNSIHEQEVVLAFSLDPVEQLAKDTTSAQSFQTFVKDRRKARETAIVGPVQIDAAAVNAHPSLGKSLHAVIHSNEGLLTFFPDRLQFDSKDVRIVFPLSEVARFDAAGARETFLLVQVEQGNGLTREYGAYQVCCTNNGRFQFVLSPDEPVAPAFSLASDFQQYAAAMRADGEHALVASGRQDTAATASGAKPSTRKELGRFDAGFVEHHNPNSTFVNSIKLVSGIPGTLIVFDNAVGYVSSASNPSVKAPRQAFLQNGYLKFLVPSTAILGIRDVSVIRRSSGTPNDSFIAEVDVDRTSEFFQKNKPLLAESDQDNRIFFTFRDRSGLTRFMQTAPHGLQGRDTF